MSATFDQGYALLIGVDANSVPQWSLPVVARDVAALQAVLVHPDRCAYLPDHVRVLTGEHATKAEILASLDWLQTCIAANPGVSAVVYYSGHGWRNNEVDPACYYLIPYDMRSDRLRSSALRAEDFAEAIAMLQPQRLLVVLDCCHAAGMGTKGAKDDSSPAAQVADRFAPAALPVTLLAGAGALTLGSAANKDLAQLQRWAGRAVLTSSTGLQSSYVRRDGKLSVFTYCLIEALTGYAQPQGGAAEVLVSDVLSYVYRRVPDLARQEWQADQQPDGSLDGNFAVALLLAGKGLPTGAQPPDPLAELPAPSATDQINTGGGAYIAGHVDIQSGSFIGRDQTNITVTGTPPPSRRR